MSILFDGMGWGSWYLIWYAALFVAVVATIAVVRYVKKRRSARLLMHGVAGKHMLLHFSLARQMLKVILWVAGAAFLAIALLQPQWDKKEEVVEQQGRDLLIALDISRSMLAQDYMPNRLAYAKQKITQLVALLSSERVGLILFSDSAFVQCPLTQDIPAFLLFLDTVDAETISSGSTAIGGAVSKALDVFATLQQRQNKLLVVFTDGEDFSSNLASVKQRAQEVGLHIFTVGIGTQQGAPIPIIDAHGNRIGHEKDAAGTVVMSRLNEDILRNLADDLHGVYVQATPDDRDVKTIVKEVEKFEKEALDDKKITRLEEQYPWFVGCAFILFLLEWLL